MALSDSKFNDPQAGMETGVGAFLAAMRGHQLGLRARACSTTSTASASRSWCSTTRWSRTPSASCARSRCKDDLPAAELLAELVRDKHLLTSEHTLARWPEELYLPGPMVDRTNWDQWAGPGLARLARARQRGDRRDARRYEVEPLPEALHTEIRDLFVPHLQRGGGSRCPRFDGDA